MHYGKIFVSLSPLIHFTHPSRQEIRNVYFSSSSPQTVARLHRVSFIVETVVNNRQTNEVPVTFVPGRFTTQRGQIWPPRFVTSSAHPWYRNHEGPIFPAADSFVLRECKFKTVGGLDTLTLGSERRFLSRSTVQNIVGDGNPNCDFVYSLYVPISSDQ